MSPWLDVRSLAETFGVMRRGRGAEESGSANTMTIAPERARKVLTRLGLLGLLLALPAPTFAQQGSVPVMVPESIVTSV